MPPMLDIGFDAASAISLGRRDHQEDAVAVDFPTGAGLGFAVISDGMGGHQPRKLSVRQGIYD